jgi:hypothetical protein
MTACKMLSVLQRFESEWEFDERMIWGEEGKDQTDLRDGGMLTVSSHVQVEN